MHDYDFNKKRYNYLEKYAANKIYTYWQYIKSQIHQKKQQELDEEYLITHLSSRPQKFSTLKNTIKPKVEK